MNFRRFRDLLAGALLVLAACSPSATIPPTPAILPLDDELIFHFWEGVLSQEIIDSFKAEYGVTVTIAGYASNEEAVNNLKAGNLYDVVALGNDEIGSLLGTGLLAALDLSNIPNLRNVSVNFRDLAYDPGNRYSIPHNWGTTGLVYRTDLVGRPITSWNDLWDPTVGQVGYWDDYRSMLGLTLRSLGYSANSGNPDELNEALQKLLDLKKHSLNLYPLDPYSSAPPLSDGTITLAFGWAYDVLIGRDLNPNIAYTMLCLVLPDLVVILELTGGGDEQVLQPAGSVGEAVQLMKR